MAADRWLSGACVVAVLAASLAAIRANAAQVFVQAGRDNTIFSASQNSFGAGVTITAGNSGDGSPRRALVWFDLDGRLPAGSVVTGVSLSLVLEGAPSQEPTGTLRAASLHRLVADWGEGTSGAGQSGGAPGLGQGAAATPGDATWTNSFYDTVTWTAPGGDFAALASAATDVGTATDTAYVWGSTAALVADVQAWLDEPALNFGWVVLGVETGQRTNRRFYSREIANEAWRPTLAISYVAATPDLNMDGRVDIFDVAIVSNHWGATGEPGAVDGDANADGIVDIFDVALISNQWNPGGQSQRVPEPSTIALTVLAACGIVHRGLNSRSAGHARPRGVFAR